MPTVVFSGVLARHLQAAPGEHAGATVREVLEAAFARSPRLRGYLLDDQGAVRKHVAIYLNDQPITDRASQSDRLAAPDRVLVFRALSGG